MPRSRSTMQTAPSREADQDVHYTFLIRAPFARGDFVDPPRVDWTSEKDRELWEILSRSSAKAQELDWQELAERFDVDLAFLTQQAAWLYERQLSQVRAQLRKANQSSSSSKIPPSPDAAAGSTMLAGGHPMSRVGSAGSRAPSSLSVRLKERTLSHGDSQRGDVKASKALSRQSSAATVTQLAGSPSARRSPADVQSSHRPRRESQESRRSVESSPGLEKPPMERIHSSSAIDSSSSSDSEPEPAVSRSRTFARRPRYASAKSNLNALPVADEDDETDPYLPFSTLQSNSPAERDPGATLKTTGSVPKQQKTLAARQSRATAMHPAYSSSSSNQSQAQPRGSPKTRPTPLSPQQRRLAKEAASDGTPSMGSSFSDLDDASVTQSALEEAMAGEMQTGGMASRMSTISQALRSKYL